MAPPIEKDTKLSDEEHTDFAEWALGLNLAATPVPCLHKADRYGGPLIAVLTVKICENGEKTKAMTIEKFRRGE